VTAPLTTSPDPELVHLDRQLRASLPLSYAAAVDGQDADVALVAGSADWPRRATARVRDGSPCAVVIDPRPADAESIRALAGAGGEVILSEPLASHPSVPAIAEALDGTDTLVLSSLDPRPASAQVFDQIRLLRALGVSDIRPLDVLDNGASVLVTVGGVRGDIPMRVRIVAVTTRAGRPRYQIRAYGVAASVSAELPGPETARTAAVATNSPVGTVTVATTAETAHRVALRQVRAGTALSDLEGFAADVALFSDLL
jgi:hypothetical protein